MKQLAAKHKLLIIGVLLGVAYGMVSRFVFGEKATLASITFLFIIPTILGIIPLLFADDRQIRSYKNIIFIPWLTVATFFFTMFVIGIEEFLCLLVLAGPFFILGTLGAFLYRLYRIYRDKRKGHLPVLILIPFLLSPLEEQVNSPSEIYSIESEVIITSVPENVWNNIVEVQDIKEEEYQAGFFNYLGIPRPIKAEVTKKEIGGKRTGNFEGGLKFVENITSYKPLQEVSFDIKVDPESVRQNVFDQHVLNGNYFSFVNATYSIEKLNNNHLKLKLKSGYRLTSKINFYGKFWGNLILKDFQDRLLFVIKNRCEK